MFLLSRFLRERSLIRKFSKLLGLRAFHEKNKTSSVIDLRSSVRFNIPGGAYGLRGMSAFAPMRPHEPDPGNSGVGIGA